jgi:hypothetical protein
VALGDPLSLNFGPCTPSANVLGTVISTNFSVTHRAFLTADVTAARYSLHAWLARSQNSQGPVTFQFEVLHRIGDQIDEDPLATGSITISTAGAPNPIQPAINLQMQRRFEGVIPNVDEILLRVSVTTGIGIYYYGNCNLIQGNEPVGHTWLEFEGNIAEPCN